MFIPNWVNIYGSNYIRLRDKGAKHTAQSFGAFFKPELGKHYQQIMTITKTRLNGLDTPSERCSTDDRKPNTTSCIVRHFEEQLGCSINMNGGGSSGMAPCTTKEGYNMMRNMTKILDEAESNTIYSLTGCLASCQRDEYQDIDSSFMVLNKTQPQGHLLGSILGGMLGILGNTKKEDNIELELKFRIISPSYEEEDQYIIYDFNSFIGDVGGFLGLLLGYSILSLYGDMVGILERFKLSSRPKK